MDDEDVEIDLDMLGLVLEDENTSDDEDGSDEDIAKLDDWSELLDSVTKSAISETELFSK